MRIGKGYGNLVEVSFSKLSFLVSFAMVLFIFAGCSDIKKDTIESTYSSANQSNDRKITPIYDSCSNSNFQKAYNFHCYYNYDSSIFYYFKAINELKRDKDWPNLVKSLYFASEVLSAGNPKKAEALLFEALEIIEQFIPERYDCKIHIYNRFGYIYLLTGYPDKALESFKSSSGLIDSIIVDDAEIPAYIALSIGDIHRVYFENPEEAEIYYRNAVNILKNDTVEHYYYLSKAYYNLGAVYYLIEDFTKAEAFIRASIECSLKLPKHEQMLIAGCYGLLGELENAKGNFNESEINLLLSVKYHRQFNEYNYDLAEAYNRLAEVNIENNNYKKAKHYLLKASKLSNDTLPIYKQNFVLSQLLNAQILKNEKDYTKALAIIDKALKLIEGKSGTDPLLTADLYKLKGDIYSDNQHYVKAIINYQKSVESGCYSEYPIFTKFFSSSDVINPCRTAISAAKAADAYLARFLASNRKRINDIDSAITYYLFADTLIFNSRFEMSDKESKLTFLEKTREIYDNALKSVSYLPDNGSYNRNILALHFIERNKSAIMLESINRRKLLHSTLANSQIDRAERNMRLQISYACKALADERSKQDPDKLRINYYEEKKTKLNLSLDSIEQHYRHELSPYLGFNNFGITPSISEVKRKMHKKELLIEYFWGYSDLYAFYINKNNEGFLRIGQTDSIEKLTNEYFKSFTSTDSIYLKESKVDDYCKLSGSIFRNILEAILLKSNNNPDLINIIPDGPLCSIPFEALLRSEEIQEHDFSLLPYLLYSYFFSYHYSLNLWLSDDPVKKKFARSTNLLLITPESRNNMPAQEKEIEITKDLFSTVILEGKNATPLSFMKKAADADILHFTAHGQTLEKNGTENVLLLQSDSIYKKGFLSIDDIASLHLKAPLVILAACNIGSGKYYYGDGIQSLSREYIAAGCGSVLMSPDRITETTVDKIITGFYLNIAKGYSLPVSLTNAKIKYLKQADNILAHPAYWSNLRLWGNNSNPVKSSKPYFMVGSIIILLVIIVVYISKKC